MRRVARILGYLGLGWLIWRIFGPDVAPRYRGTQENPLGLPGKTAFVGRKEFFYREAGPDDAPLLVLAHGWAFDSQMTYFKLIPLLEDRFHIIAPDFRNHGKSDWIRGRFEIEDLADELAALLNAIGVRESFTLFGYSMGGMVAQAFTDRYPGRVDRLILGATAAFPIARRRVAARVAFFLARGAARLSKKESSLFTFHVLQRMGILEPRHARWMWESLLNRDPTLYYESGNAVWRFDSRSWVGKLGVPTMVIIPTNDAMVDVDRQRELAAAIPGAEVVEIVGAGHESILSRPEEFAKAISSFAG